VYHSEDADYANEGMEVDVRILSGVVNIIIFILERSNVDAGISFFNI
jgi:hypothetical protein